MPIKDFGLATIILTVIIRIILWPLFTKSFQSQKELQEIQPLVKKIQQEHKNDKVKQSQALMELYKERKINPFSGIFVLILQFPVLIALYSVFTSGFHQDVLEKVLYGFVSLPSSISGDFLGTINLFVPSLIMTVIAVAAQLIQSWMTMSSAKAHKQDPQKHIFDFTQKPFIFIFALVTFFVLWRLPAVLSLYIFILFFIGIIQQHFINRSFARKALITQEEF